MWPRFGQQGTNLILFPKHCRYPRTRCSEGGSGAGTPPPQNGNTQHNVNSSDPDRSRDPPQGRTAVKRRSQHWTQLCRLLNPGRAAEYKLSSQADPFLSWISHTLTCGPGQGTQAFCTSGSSVCSGDNTTTYLIRLFGGRNVRGTAQRKASGSDKNSRSQLSLFPLPWLLQHQHFSVFLRQF